MAIRRHYIETGDVSGSTEAQLALAEELIDRYVGPQDRALPSEYHGQISTIGGSGNKTITDTHSPGALNSVNGQFANAVIEMVSGAAAGQRAVIQSSDLATQGITLWAAFTTTPAVGDYFKVYQLAKFPRYKDIYSTPDGLNRYATIPEAVREATVAQVEFIIAKGAGFFTGDNSDMQSESFLNYSYTRSSSAGGQSSLSNLISPQARVLLRGIVNRKGTMFVGGHNVRKYPV